MIDVEAIPRGMEVLDNAEVHVGHVLHHEGAGIRLSNRDAPDGHHHYIPRHWIARVAEHVHLKRAAADVFDTWPGGHPAGRGDVADTPKPRGKRRLAGWGALAAGGIVLVLALL